MSRDRLLGLLWPERPEELGRHALSQTIYSLRRDFEVDVLTGSNELRLDPAYLSSDVGEFLAAGDADDRVRQGRLYAGPFLDGFYLPETPEFERWVEAERARLRQLARDALLQLARETENAGAHRAAVEWLRRLVELDPLSGDLAVRLMRALAAAGDRAGALAHGRMHEALVRRELDTPPDAEVGRTLDALRLAPPGSGWSMPPVTAPAEPRRPEAGTGPTSANLAPDPSDRAPRRPARLLGTLALLALTLVALGVWLARSRGDPAPRTLAVGILRDQTVPDSLRAGSVTTDMLATSLGRLEGLRVIANSRLLELMAPGADTSRAAVSDAARRAGASELLEGEVSFAAQGGVVLELRRVDLASGLLRRGYRLSAPDRFGLVDSATAAIAQDFDLTAPGRAIADLTTTSPVAYRLYEEGLRAFYQYDAAAAYRLMTAALEQDSLFPMAAYYAWLAATRVDGPASFRLGALVRRLASRASERERLIALTHMAQVENDPQALRYADTLGIRYPEDPEAAYLEGQVHRGAGDWSLAVRALERAIAADSAAGATHATVCRICAAFGALTATYLWADSGTAQLRTARRWVRTRPDQPGAWLSLAWAAWREALPAEATQAMLRYDSLGGRTDLEFQSQHGIFTEQYESVVAQARARLGTVGPVEAANARWYAMIALRNLGRLGEAREFLRPTERSGGVEVFGEAILALETGAPRRAARVFLSSADGALNEPNPGHRARGRAWGFTLAGTALAAAGDTAEVRRLADSVEAWGRQSLFGRDARLHFFLRGLALALDDRHADAVEMYRRSLFSSTFGYTRINYELARSLLILRRPRDAILPLQLALRGGVDGGNFYVTRTELHERLAEAFAAAGLQDSARPHFRNVAAAWEHSDEQFQPKRRAAAAWLSSHQ